MANKPWNLCIPMPNRGKEGRFPKDLWLQVNDYCMDCTDPFIWRKAWISFLLSTVSSFCTKLGCSWYRGDFHPSVKSRWKYRLTIITQINRDAPPASLSSFFSLSREHVLISHISSKSQAKRLGCWEGQPPFGVFTPPWSWGSSFRLNFKAQSTGYVITQFLRSNCSAFL